MVSKDLLLNLFISKASNSIKNRLKVELQLLNNTERREILSFPTGQRFDLVLKNEAGEEVLVWSRGQFFTQVMGSLRLEPREEVIFTVILDISLIEPGLYQLQGIIPAIEGGSQKRILSKPMIVRIH